MAGIRTAPSGGTGSPNPCSSEYDYHFVVEYRYRFSLRKARLPQSSNAIVPVTLFGQVSWFEEYYRPVSGNGAVTISPYRDSPTLYVQNLSSQPITLIASIANNYDPNTPSIPKFSTDFMNSVPPSNLTIQCGAFHRFAIGWNRLNRPSSADREEATL